MKKTQNMRYLSSTLVLLTFINLVNYLDRYILAAVAPQVQAEFDLSNFQIGSLMSAFMIGYMLMSPVFGYLGDRYNRPLLMSLGILMWSVATFFAGFANSFLLFFLLRILVGVGEASYASIAPGFVRDELKDETLTNKALAVFYTAIPIGAALGYVWGGLSGKYFSWHWAFLGGGLPGVLLGVMVLRCQERPRQVLETSLTLKNMMTILKDLWSNRPYRYCVLGYTAYTFGLGGFAAWAPQFGVKVLGADIASINLLMGAVTIVAGSLGTIIGGRIGHMFFGKLKDDKVSGFNYFNMWTSLIATPFAFVALFVDHYIVFIIVIFVVQIVMFAASAPINTAILTSVPSQIATTGMAVSIFVIHALGDLISPALVGLLADVFPLRIAMIILPLSIFLSALFWWLQFYRDRRHAI